MNILKINYDQVPYISKRDLAYITGDEKLRPFYKYDFDYHMFSKVIADRESYPVDRELLVECLKEQYDGVDASSSTMSNISALHSVNAYTVVTAHQPSLLTGPLYFIYKICSVINLCKQLKETYSTKEFIPTLILGSEDHDFEEINHLRLYNKEISWATDQTGATGRMSVQGIDEVIDKVEEILSDGDHAKEIIQIFRESKGAAKSYFEFVFGYVNALFKEYGLVIVNMDNKKLKGAFSNILSREIFENMSEQIVNETIAELEKTGFKAQASPRAINLFYLGEGFRERIVFEDGVYKVLNTKLQFSKEEIKEELQNHPDRFSPNVVMRPLYQEYSLPNLAYVGGGGELAYWMERKSQFDAANIFYPMLIRRNSVQWNDTGMLKQQQKIGFDSSKLMDDEHSLIKSFIAVNEQVEFDITSEKTSIGDHIDYIAAKAKEIEAPLEKYVMAEKTKLLKSIEHIESKLQKAIKQKHDTSINKIKKLKLKTFPNQSLQERQNNFLQQYASHGKNYLDFLIANLNPFDKHYLLIEEDL